MPVPVEPQEKTATKFRFGLFEADAESGELRRSGIRIRIQAQPFRLLLCLLERPGEVVSREEIQQKLWGADTIVDFDHSLGTAINKVRECLGDSAENPRFIETLARRGYRFIAPVTTAVHGDIPAAPAPPITSDATSLSTSDLPAPASTASAAVPWYFWLVVAFAILSMGTTAWLALRAAAGPSIYRITAVTHDGHALSDALDVENLAAMATEGGHIYFSQLENGRPVLAEALTENGEVQDLHLPAEIAAPLICAISPDGTRLLVRNHLGREPEQSLWIVPTLGGQARRFGAILAHDAAWTPDGQHIVYARGNALFIAREDGQESQPLVSVPGRAFWLRWSPDGRLLRFTLLQPGSRTPSLWEYDSASRQLRPLLPGWSHPSAECCGSWTPDGKDYIFQSAHFSSPDIWRMPGSPRGGTPTPLTSGPLEYEAPAPGSSPGTIFFTGVDARRETLVSSAVHHFQPLENNLGSAALVEYSRDGRWVAWLNASDGTLWRSRVDSSERLQLTSPPLSIFSIRWSPDDRTIALMARKPGQPFAIYLLDVNGGNLQPLVEEKRGQADPNWFPDGSALLYGNVPDILGGETQPKALYTVDLHSRTITPVPGSEGLFSPRLSPDGRSIAALSQDQKSLMLMDRGTGRWKRLIDGGVADPVWSADSQSIFYQNFLEPNEPIYSFHLPAGPAHQIASLIDLDRLDAVDYRLITLAPGDRPVVNTQSSSVNIYTLSLK